MKSEKEIRERMKVLLDCLKVERVPIGRTKKRLTDGQKKIRAKLNLLEWVLEKKQEEE